MRVSLGLGLGVIHKGSNPAPTVVSVSPGTGSLAGGTAITVTGTGFRTGATVALSGTSCTGVTVVNATTITCTTPAHTAGAKTCRVTNTDAQFGDLLNAFTYYVDTPVSLSLTGYWRGSFGGSPWAGVASAGTSSGRDLTEATNPPAVGATQNGYAPAAFDGTNDKLTPAGTLDTYANGTAVSGWALIRLDPATSSGIVFSVPGFQFEFYWTSDEVVHFALNSAAVHVTKALPAGAYALATFRYDGVNAQIGVNEAPGASGGGSTAAFGTAISSLTGIPQFGPAAGWAGRVLEFGISDTALSDANFSAIKTYVNARYALSL